jgi:hypothetical protein
MPTWRRHVAARVASLPIGIEASLARCGCGILGAPLAPPWRALGAPLARPLARPWPQVSIFGNGGRGVRTEPMSQVGLLCARLKQGFTLAARLLGGGCAGDLFYANIAMASANFGGSPAAAFGPEPPRGGPSGPPGAAVEGVRSGRRSFLADPAPPLPPAGRRCAACPGAYKLRCRQRSGFPKPKRSRC